MNHRIALLASCALTLAACSGAPTRQADRAADSKIIPADTTTTVTTVGRRKVSPYAPAQEDPGKRGDYTRGGLYAPHIQDSVPGDLPDVDSIPEPDVVDEPRSSYGNRSPYNVLGKNYQVLDSAGGYDEVGTASFYGNKFHGRRTSNLEVYDMYAFTAAHRTLPLPSFARVTNLDNGKSVVVRINDRGPFHDGRLIDLSYAAAVKLGITQRGTGRVQVQGLRPGDVGNNVYASRARAASPTSRQRDPATGLPQGVHIATGKPQPASAIDTLVQALPLATGIATASAAERAPPVVKSSDAKSADAQTLAADPSDQPTPGGDWRFDMRQDGRAMTANEFDAWMRARRARVATGRSGKPDPYGAAAPRTAPARGVVAESTTKASNANPTDHRDTVRESPAPIRATTTSAADGNVVTLQVAAFAARGNAERALAMLHGAGIGEARVQDGMSGGKPVWRLRVGPVARGSVSELSARVAGLGFGQPQIVRE